MIVSIIITPEDTAERLIHCEVLRLPVLTMDLLPAMEEQFFQLPMVEAHGFTQIQECRSIFIA